MRVIQIYDGGSDHLVKSGTKKESTPPKRLARCTVFRIEP